MLWRDTLYDLHHSDTASVFLRSLTIREQDLLTERALLKEFRKNEILVRQGEEGDSMYLLLEGSVKVCVETTSGQTSIVNFILPGDIVGELTPIDRLPRSGTCTALEDGAALVIHSAVFFAALQKDIGLTQKVLRELSRKIRVATNALVAHSAGTPEETLARAILSFGLSFLDRQTDGSYLVKVPLTQIEMARMAGLGRKSMWKLLGQWKDQGIAVMEGHHLRILNLNHIQHLAETE